MTISVRCLSVAYEDHVVLDRVSLTVKGGSWTTLIGPNGAGKSSLIRAVAGLIPYQGEIGLGESGAADRLTRREVARIAAYVPQHPELPPSMTVFDYALLGRTPHIGYFGVDSNHDREVAWSVLGRLGLEEMAARRLGSLSGGETQRVVLSRALCQQAPVLLLDEPTTGLDLGHQQRVLELVDSLRHESDLAVLSSMHDLMLAGQFTDDLVLLVDGRVVAAGAPRDVLTRDLISHHYRATVEVEVRDEQVLVIPERDRRALLTRSLQSRVDVEGRASGTGDHLEALGEPG